MELNIVHCFQLLAQDSGLSHSEIAYLCRRVRNEGLPFLTQTLPAFYKWVLGCIENCAFKLRLKTFTHINLQTCASLRRWRLELASLDKGGCPTAIFVKQLANICNYFYKLSLPATPEQQHISSLAYIAVQDEPLSDTLRYDVFLEQVRATIESDYSLSSLKLSDVVNNARSGPGSIVGAKGHAQAAKDCQNATVPLRYCAYEGAFRYRVTSVYKDRTPGAPPKKVRIRRLKKLEPDYCEVNFVPKDARGPRVISKETYHRSMLALGFHDAIKPILERATGGRIQFTDQSIFNELARIGSLDGTYDTFDLKEASDRHRIIVARRLYRNIPVIRYALVNFRARFYRLPTSRRIRALSSVAGMGSGLTFPLMALTIHAAVVTLLRKRGYHDAAKNVYVYGDDIIVPHGHRDIVVEALTRVGFLVNEQKSFTKGSFRESCGGDYLNGINVTPVRLTQTFCDNLVTKDMRLVPDPRSRTSCNADKFVYKLERHCRNLVDDYLVRLSRYYYRKIDEYLASKGLRLGVTNDFRDPILARYNPYLYAYIGPPQDNLCAFKPVQVPGDLNRLIRRKLGGETHNSPIFSQWLREEESIVPEYLTGSPLSASFALATLHHACLDPDSLQLQPSLPMRDSLRYAGAIVKL